nr:hypothetical protein [Streptomyces phaeochromogenes]
MTTATPHHSSTTCQTSVVLGMMTSASAVSSVPVRIQGRRRPRRVRVRSEIRPATGLNTIAIRPPAPTTIPNAVVAPSPAMASR